MSIVNRSWNAFSSEVAGAYLKTFGAPAVSSKHLLLDVLREAAQGRRLALLDLGCGNGQLGEFLLAHGLDCDYTGVDFSEPLLEAARLALPDASFVRDDVHELGRVEGRFDYAVYSHVLEMLESPQRSLASARRVADRIAIRFFEPPEFDADTVELREMDVGEGPVPYLRRKLSRDHYRLILARIGCTAVDVFRDDSSTDQVHVLHF